MSTTNTFQGLREGSKSSSRVLRPPGGGSSNIFMGGDPEPVKTKDYNRSDVLNQKADVENLPVQQKTAEQKPVGAAAAPFASDAAPTPEQKASKPVPMMSSPFAVASSECAPARAEKRGGGVNPITGEQSTSAAKDESPSTHTSTRVRQPPGGASSGLW